MTFENNYDANKIDDLETQHSPDTRLIVEQMKNIDTQQQLEQESVEKMNGVLNTMEQLPGNEFAEKNSGLLRNLSEQAKKGALIGAAALGITAAASSPVFGEQLAQNGIGGKLRVSEPITAKTYLPENVQAVDKRLNVEAADFNNPNRIHLRPLNQIRLEGQQKNLIRVGGKNIYNGNNQAFQGQLNQYEQRQTLPGATVNGEGVYEIAPGVYGNRHSQHGDGIRVGTIEIN